MFNFDVWTQTWSVSGLHDAENECPSHAPGGIVNWTVSDPVQLPTSEYLVIFTAVYDAVAYEHISRHTKATWSHERRFA